MNPRIRRLQADAQQMARSFHPTHPFIRIQEARGTPPESYVLQMNITGLVPSTNGGIVVGNSHLVEVFLPVDYPRRQPLCRMNSPVFHPNIDPQKICIGDHWSAGQSLAHLVVRIAEMITFQSYNIKSPLDAKAAAWAEQNPERLPLETVDFFVD